jgi:O-antigen/teichoic acid export membrane protein
LRNSGWLFSAKGVGAVLSIFYLAFLTRSLGVAGFGSFIVIIALAQLAAGLLRPQSWQSVVHFGQQALARDDAARFDAIVTANLLVELAGGALLLLAVLIALLVGQPAGWSEAERHGVLIYSALLALAPRSTPTGILRCHDRFRDGALGDVVIPGVRFGGCIVVAGLGGGMTGYLIVWGLSDCAAAALLWVQTLRHRCYRPVRKVIFGEGYAQFLFATHAAALLTNVRERGVVLLFALLVSDSAAGLFRLADQLANSLTRLTEIFAGPIFAELSRAFGAAQPDRTVIRTLFFRALRWAAIGGLILFAALYLGGEWLIMLMSGAAYLPAYPLLILLGAATSLMLTALALEPLLQAGGQAGRLLAIRLGATTTLFGALMLVLPFYGSIGGAWVMLAAALLTVTAMLGAALRLLARTEVNAR